MSSLMGWINKHISVGELVMVAVFIFSFGGFWYTTTDDIKELQTRATEIESTIHINRNEIQTLQTRQGRIDQRLESSITRQDERYSNIQKQLKYIINRLDTSK